jgi:hypothetical protein
MFMNRASGKYSEFEHMLLQYINIVAPIIRSLWSLEAAHANAADVFIFWLAISATLNHLFSQGTDKTGITITLANGVTAVFNKRYKEFFSNEVYFTAFALDPREFAGVVSLVVKLQLIINYPGYPLADFLKKPPPPGPTTIIIPPAAHINGQRATPLPYPHAHGRVKNFLKDMLREKLRLFPKGLIEPALTHIGGMSGHSISQ